jgi:hypothetical protein
MDEALEDLQKISSKEKLNARDREILDRWTRYFRDMKYFSQNEEECEQKLVELTRITNHLARQVQMLLESWERCVNRSHSKKIADRIQLLLKLTTQAEREVARRKDILKTAASIPLPDTERIAKKEKIEPKKEKTKSRSV